MWLFRYSATLPSSLCCPSSLLSSSSSSMMRRQVPCALSLMRTLAPLPSTTLSHHIQTARVRRTSSWRSVCWNPGQNGRCPKLLKIPNSECPDIWIRLPRHKWPKSWSSMEDPVVPLERNLHDHPLAGLLLERQFEKILLGYGREKVSNWE